MRNIIIVLVNLILFPFIISGQVIKGIDQVTPFHEELAAVKKGDTWAFINTLGEVVIDYRSDLVSSKTNKKEYPFFLEGKCMIKQMIDGIYYYGYIDTKGQVVIKPQYLNAANFHHGHAIVLKLDKEKLGDNKVLGKNVISYSYDEVVIDHSGNEKVYLIGPIHIPLKKETIKNPPTIQSYLLSKNIAVTKNKENKLQIHSLLKQ